MVTNIKNKKDEWEDFDHDLKQIIKRKKHEKLTWKEIDKFCNWACMEKNNYSICWKWCRNKIKLQKEYFYSKLDEILKNIY